MVSCRKDISFQEKICSMYVGKTLKELPNDRIVNKDVYNLRQHNNYVYKLIHTMEITCNSCVNEINEVAEFIHKLEGHQVLFEIIGYSSYFETKFPSVLLQYPFYYDCYRKFSSDNKLTYDDITRTFLIKDSVIVCVGDLKDEKFRNEIFSKVTDMNLFLF
jgi:hypothetical protein